MSYGMFIFLYGKIKGISKNDVQIQETKLEKDISYKIFFVGIKLLSHKID